MTDMELDDMKAISFRFSEAHDPDTMYIKEYSPKSYDERKPLGRTLLVSKVPLYINETDIKKLFSEIGEVLTVDTHKGKMDMECCVNCYQCAFIVYKSRESLVKALNIEMLKTLTDQKYTPRRGLLKYIKEYNDSIVDHSTLMKEATKAIQLYDKQEEEKKMKEKNKVDDDGWTVVTSKGKKLISDSKLDEKVKKQNQKKQQKNFYTFQIRESKKRNLEDLRAGYEEAKRKVANMKKNRSFKPF